MKVFKNLKVLELSSVLAGPSVGLFFAELGAKVIKIENKKTRGDVTRTWKLPSENSKEKESNYYWSVNALKEILFLDFTSENDLKTLYKLVEDSDIVITNFKKGDDKKLKADYKIISKINPRIIYASINSFGENSSRVAYDLILQAESGFMSMNGEVGAKPLKMPVAMIDLLAAHQLKEAILIALLKRLQTQKGSHISVSLFDSALASLANQASNWLNSKQIPHQIGSLHPNIAPYGEVFETKDKHFITFAIGSNSQFETLLEILKLSSKDKFSDNQNRIKNRNELFLLLSKKIKTVEYKKIYSACLKKNTPIGKLRNLKEVFELPESKLMTRKFLHQKKKINFVSSIAFKFLD